MTKKKSLLALFSILGLSLILLSQCTGSGQTPTGGATDGKPTSAQKPGERMHDGASQTIHVALSVPTAEFDSLRKLSDKYMEANPGIDVQLINMPDKEAYAKLKKASQLGEAPDLMLLDNTWVDEFAALGFLQPVDEYFTSERATQRIEQAMTQVKWNGYIWGIPKDVDPYILVWSKKAAAELKAEGAPGSAEEMTAWNKRFMKPDEGSYGIYVDPTDPDAVMALLSSLGGAMGDAAVPALKAAEPAAQRAMETFFVPQEAGWNGKLFALNYPQAGAVWNPWELLYKGKMAAMVTTISAFNQHARDEIALAALPQGAGAGKGVWLQGRSFCVSARTDNAKAAMDWIKAMTSVDAAMKLWTETKKLPTQLSVYSTPTMRTDEHFHSYDWLVSNGKSLPFDTENAKKLAGMQAELERLHKSEIDLKTFGERLAKLWGGDKQPTPSETAESSASPAANKLPGKTSAKPSATPK